MNIRTSPVDALSLEELVLANAFLGLLNDRILDNDQEVPASVQAELKEVNAVLTAKLRADKERKLQLAERRLEQLLPEREKRQIVEDEIAKLRAELGMDKPKAARSARAR
jgi:hypothetical protein